MDIFENMPESVKDSNQRFKDFFETEHKESVIFKRMPYGLTFYAESGELYLDISWHYGLKCFAIRVLKGYTGRNYYTKDCESIQSFFPNSNYNEEVKPELYKRLKMHIAEQI